MTTPLHDAERDAIANPTQLPKAPTGIHGLDLITGGGLPRGRPTLVCGNVGCGKTLFGMEFLVRGATSFGEPGVFIAFEETRPELVQNAASLGFALADLEAAGRLVIDQVCIERAEIEAAGEYDLEGLFIRIGHAIDAIGARRVVLDTLEMLFAGLDNQAVLRSEIRRLFRWLKDRGVTAVITAERGGQALTRHGLEEYVSDCVVLLDHRVQEQISTRRLRIVKYRGSHHGTNEYPFFIDETGFNVLPLSAAQLDHQVSTRRISTGIAGLDAMVGGEGVFAGSTVLISGTPGTGKTTVCAHFVQARCRDGERCLYFAFEESPAQLIRNLRSVGIDLAPPVDQGLLRIVATRPSFLGLEQHLAMMHRTIREFAPTAVVIDPLSSLIESGQPGEVRSVCVRLIDSLKSQGITAVIADLSDADSTETSQVGISSLADTWLLLRDIELWGERNRGLHVLKARGLAHSNQIREFVLTAQGVVLKEIYVGPEGVLTGSARVAQENHERAAKAARRLEVAARQRTLLRARQAAEARMRDLREELAALEHESEQVAGEMKEHEAALSAERMRMARSRHADPAAGLTTDPAQDQDVSPS